jgi:hypothetical protein
MDLLVFVLASYGATNVVTAGRLFAGLRSRLAAFSPLLGHWATCPMCLGFPVGVLWSALGLGPGTALGTARDLAAAGAISSGACWLLRVLAHALGEDEL